MSTHTAILVSPEEAEELIPLCRDAPKRVVHLLAYAAPVTQKMLHFNELTYYAIPPLPTECSAPVWLKIQVGFFAGRLYFPFEELGDIRAFLGLQDDETSHSPPNLVMNMDELQIEDLESSDDNQASAADEQQPVRDGNVVTKEESAA